MAKAMVEEYKADGLLLAPSRSCETDFRTVYVGMQRIFKSQIPTVEYDSDQVDGPENGFTRSPTENRIVRGPHESA